MFTNLLGYWKPYLLGLILLPFALVEFRGCKAEMARHRYMRYFAPDIEAYHFSNYLCNDIFETTGQKIYSFAALKHSRYFPYLDGYRTLHGGDITFLRTSVSRDLIQLKLNVPESDLREKFRSGAGFTVQYSATPLQLTLRKIKLFNLGIEGNLKHILDDRDMLIQAEKFAANKEVPEVRAKRLLLKPPPKSPIESNFPQNAGDAVKYLNWICLNVGVKKLVDGWGHPFDLEKQNGRYFLRSRGKDGKPGTADDVAHNTRTHTNTQALDDIKMSCTL